MKYESEYCSTAPDWELLPLHIFQLEINAYYHMRRTQQDQCILHTALVVLIGNLVSLLVGFKQYRLLIFFAVSCRADFSGPVSSHSITLGRSDESLHRSDESLHRIDAIKTEFRAS